MRIPVRCWAVGVGPGDPELLTLKAVRLIQQADVLYHAGPAPRDGRALDVVRGWLRDWQRSDTVLDRAMSDIDPDDWRSAYRAGSERIITDCRAGRQVVFLTEGDPTLYSTASYVWQLLGELAPELPLEIVPGITSITAAAARVGWPLAQRDAGFAVLPATMALATVPALLDVCQTVCVLKPSGKLPQLTELVARQGCEAIYLDNVTTATEFITTELATVGAGRYFALLLVRRRTQVDAKAGKVAVIGIGPGDVRLMTQQALSSLRAADAVVGYEAYLSNLPVLNLKATLHSSPIGAETERAALALELAAAGKQVALVSSGDAGVYGMASLLLERAAEQPMIEIEVVPGITAATAAAALLGAPLGHDFACISLSDLLTPWKVIEQRLHAAAQGDFVVALYNPTSRQRTWQLPQARDIVLQYRRPQTPVGIVERAYRPGTRVRTTTLAELTTDGITMETIVLIGSSKTQLVHGRMVTPRGYGEQA